MRLTRSCIVAAAVCFCGLAIGRPTEAAVVLQADFNGENGGNPMLNFGAFADFNVTAGSVDLIGPGLFDFYPDNGRYVDLNGSTGVSGTLTSTASFAPGLYQLTFSIGNNPSNGATNSVTVTMGGFSETFTRSGTVPLMTITRTFSTATTAPLVFATPAGDSDFIGIVIDNVRLETVATVPETSTLTLAGTCALAGIGTLRRRRGAS